MDANNVPYPCSVYEAEWQFNDKRRFLKQDYVSGCKVSTVFLVVNHAWDGGDPVLFETMIFTNRKGNFRAFQEAQWRYTTYKEAMISHDNIVDAIKRKELMRIRYW